VHDVPCGRHGRAGLSSASHLARYSQDARRAIYHYSRLGCRPYREDYHRRLREGGLPRRAVVKQAKRKDEARAGCLARSFIYVILVIWDRRILIYNKGTLLCYN
jgi:hypothetical protein